MADPAVRRTQEERRAETGRRVLAAATTLIAAHGSRSVTLAEVGEAAGYSRGIVHHHFGSRERLLAAVMADAQRFSAPAYAGNGLEQICGIVEAYLRNVVDRSPSARAFLQLWSEAIAGDPVLAPMFARHDASFRSYLADRVRVGIADGSVLAAADPEAAGVFLMALVRGTGLQLIATPPPGSFPAIVAEARRATRGAFGSRASS
jgi:AcrR family transcriptional regulator